MKILITGDLVIDRAYEESNISESIISLFEQADLKIVNLEAPVTTSISKIVKTGPHLKSYKESTLQILKLLGVDIVTLANNHVLDYDEKGVTDTLEFCKKHQIETVGAGENLEFAQKTLFIERQGKKIAVVNFAENEWASATPSSAGANPLDLIDNVKKIREAKAVSDYVIVIVHGGHEYYNLPSPRMQKQYRFFAEEGADIVIGHHPHCITGHEVYQGVPIYYSLGNFLFTLPSGFEDWYTGLVLELELTDQKIKTQLHVVHQDKETFALKLESGLEAAKVFERLSNYDAIIQEPLNLQKEWQLFINSKYDAYLRYWSPTSFVSNRFIKAAFNRLGINFLNKKSSAYQLNLMRCEAHHDVSKEVVHNYLFNK